MKSLDIETIKHELEGLVNWEYNNNAIEKRFVFKNFSQALAFIVQVGVLSEKKNHHPEFTNSYNKVTIRLTTHDANGVTIKDFDLAKAIDEL
jgi:4a-hydroxytetrahydrobiopterin dehydratase